MSFADVDKESEFVTLLSLREDSDDELPYAYLQLFTVYEWNEVLSSGGSTSGDDDVACLVEKLLDHKNADC
ncbi:unnamed protein product [Amoebophrya sp. A25]|nr:unnamed protein product [Amoebophrya sp. A25]|eukprot:GSA25T00009159001.1